MTNYKTALKNYNKTLEDRNVSYTQFKKAYEELKSTMLKENLRKILRNKEMLIGSIKESTNGKISSGNNCHIANKTLKDFSGEVSFTNSLIENCDFSDGEIGEFNFSNCVLINCKFRSLSTKEFSFSYSHIYRSNFNKISSDHMRFESLHLDKESYKSLNGNLLNNLL